MYVTVRLTLYQRWFLNACKYVLEAETCRTFMTQTPSSNFVLFNANMVVETHLYQTKISTCGSGGTLKTKLEKIADAITPRIRTTRRLLCMTEYAASAFEHK